MMDGAAVGEWLRRRIGLDPSSGGPGLAARGLRARMKALAIPSAEWERYLALLERSETEAEALVDEVTVPESWFFRDEGPFAYLGGPIASRWLNDPARPPLRLLSVPCARGEEPYSAAIALLDRGLPPARFTVDAVDVSKPLLDAVRRGIYGDNAFRTSELAFRDRHFRPTASGYELRPELKRLVNTHHGNLIDPEFLADQRAYDVIFCRNLLIYFDEPARQRALANLDRLLSPDGILFVGHAEQLGILSPRFRPAGDRGTFAFERVAAPPESGPAAAHAPRRARSASKTEKRAAKRSGENAGTSRRGGSVGSTPATQVTRTRSRGRFPHPSRPWWKQPASRMPASTRKRPSFASERSARAGPRLRRFTCSG